MRALALLLLAAAAVYAQEAARATPAELQSHYDQAFKYYSGAEYARAIQQWEAILKLDPKQATAQRMIAMAREQLAKSAKVHRDRLLAHVRQGSYAAALLDLQELLDKDPASPPYLALQDRLEKVIALVRKAPAGTKAWRMAVLGLTGFVGLQENPQLAFDALRYARELDEAEARFPRLIELVVASRPALAEETVTPGMKLLEYKLFVGLNHIYDGKYHLAVVVLGQALALEPDDVVALKRLGSAYFALGQRKEAKEAWSHALRLSPQDDQLKQFLSQADKK